MADNTNCGFGVLVADRASDPCFSKAINIKPLGTAAPTSSTTISATTSPTTTVNPTAVPSVGSFQSMGCYVDAVSARVLVAQAVRDPSLTGMTVEKCVALARAVSWKYAGLEFGR